MVLTELFQPWVTLQTVFHSFGLTYQSCYTVAITWCVPYSSTE